jgi:hypothetical protein
MDRSKDPTPPRGTPPESIDFSPDGVDLTLIRWMLSLTPAQRLQVLQQHVNAVLRIRRGNADR